MATCEADVPHGRAAESCATANRGTRGTCLVAGRRRDGTARVCCEARRNRYMDMDMHNMYMYILLYMDMYLVMRGPSLSIRGVVLEVCRPQIDFFQ